jgi:hypothetical protein
MRSRLGKSSWACQMTSKWQCASWRNTAMGHRASLFAEQCRTPASSFDRRNGNDRITQWTEQRLALANLELPPLAEGS